MRAATLGSPFRTVAMGRVAVLLNANARDVGSRARAVVAEALPDADIFLSTTRDEAERHAAEVARRGHELVLVGGGDGTATCLINALRAVGIQLPRLGLLKLGTGNGWAHQVGARDLRWTLEKLKRDAAAHALVSERFNLIEVEGILAPFAGVGWDARILNDFADLWRGHEGLSLKLRKSLAGYFVAILTRSWPKEARAYRDLGRAQATVRVLGGTSFAVVRGADADSPDELVRLELHPGDVLHRGPVTITGCATIENFGFGLRAHPFARARRGFMSFRAVDVSVAGALSRLPSLWRGTIRHEGFKDYLVQHVRLELSRPMPFQIGGDAMGERDSIEMKVADAEVDVLSWR